MEDKSLDAILSMDKILSGETYKECPRTNYPSLVSVLMGLDEFQVQGKGQYKELWLWGLKVSPVNREKNIIGKSARAEETRKQGTNN